MEYRIGIDVGGTFTDLFLWSKQGEVLSFKVLSTPADPSEGVINGLSAIARQQRLELDELAGKIGTIVHGTTVTTNAVLTRGGVATGLLTTAGVRDALEMRRGIREEQYDNRFQNVVPLVPRSLRLPVGGRLDYKGRELEPLDLEAVREAARRFQLAGCRAVAVCFMNSFAEEGHERRAAELLREALPEAYLSVSSELLPTIRFYNRVSTTVLNAYVGPVLAEYLGNLTDRLGRIGFDGTLLIMQSNGGVALPEMTARRAANTLLSGPAAGPRAALAYIAQQNQQDSVLVDMGGTSFDASLVQDGEAALCTEGEIDRLRIALPMLDICTIGAGGGSIGQVDEGGLLRMGPSSAGADPGPACYGRGGERPTCTDADLLLGYLDPAFFAGGELPLDVERAREAIRREIAEPLGLEPEAAAAGMYRVINSNMAHGVREITTRRGVDPRGFPLVVAGGAGALHATEIARELGISTLLVPPTASILCAAGMLLSDLQHDFVRSYVTSFEELDWERLESLIRSMLEQGGRQLAEEGIAKERCEHQVALDLRYVKQYHEVTVAVPLELLERRDGEGIAAIFHQRHDQLYGYDLKQEATPLELINVRARSLGRTEKPSLPRLEPAGPNSGGTDSGGADPGAAEKGYRRIFVPEREAFGDAPVYDGHLLRAGNIIQGPALIERTDTTIFVGESFTAEMDGLGSCRLSSNAGGLHDG